VDQVADFAGDVLLGMTAGPLEAITKQGLEHLITHEGRDIEAHDFRVNTGALHPLVPMGWGDLRLIPADWQVGVAHRLAGPLLLLLLALLLLEHLGDAFGRGGERFNAVGDLLQKLDLRIGLAWGHWCHLQLEVNCQ